MKSIGAALVAMVILSVAPGTLAQAETSVVDVRPGFEGVLRVNGEVISADSKNPNLVKILPRSTNFPGRVFVECAAGGTGVGLVEVRWKDEAGREQTTFFVVACGVQIDRTLNVAGAATETVAAELPELKGTDPGNPPIYTSRSLSHLNVEQQVYRAHADQENGRITFTLGQEGTAVSLWTVPRDGKDVRIVITVTVGPKKVSQLIVPADRVRQAVLQPGQCPPGLAYTAALSTPQTPAQFADQGFERLASALATAGFQQIHRTVCRRTGGARGYWNLVSQAARVETNPLTPAAMEEAMHAIRDFFRGRLQSVRESPVVSAPLGDQATAMTAQFRLSGGDLNELLIYAARIGNLVYWIVGQGQQGSLPTSVPETTVFPLMQQMRRNIDSVR